MKNGPYICSVCTDLTFELFSEASRSLEPCKGSHVLAFPLCRVVLQNPVAGTENAVIGFAGSGGFCRIITELRIECIS